MTFLLSSILGSGGGSGASAEQDFNKYAIWAGRNPLYSSGYRYNDNAGATGAESFTIHNGSATSWSVPTGVTRIRITTIGGGGSGGTRQGNHYHGGGGGGGAAFAVAEYDVTPGQGLTILAGNAATHSTSQGHQYNGQQSYAQSSSDGGAAINIYANGGSGGQGYNAGSGSSSKQAAGSAIDASTKLEYNGGSGGQGSTLSFGFGPEPYGAAGGGAAGYVVGNGGNGANNNSGGYSTFSSGGGAIGGYQGGRGRTAEVLRATTNTLLDLELVLAQMAQTAHKTTLRNKVVMDQTAVTLAVNTPVSVVVGTRLNTRKGKVKTQRTTLAEPEVAMLTSTTLAVAVGQAEARKDTHGL